MDNYNFDNIYLVGDTHGDNSYLSEKIEELPKDSLVIHVGDFGVGFPEIEWAELRAALQEHGSCKLWVIRGNHDDPSKWPCSDFLSDGLENVELISDFSYRKINNLIWFFVGGAVSIDRYLRIKGKDWWPDEIVKNDPTIHYKKCNVLITHTSPKKCYPHDSKENLKELVKLYTPEYRLDLKEKMFNDLVKERKILDEIMKKVKPEYHIAGHFHNSHREKIQTSWGKCSSFILDINEIIDFNQIKNF